MPGPYVTQACVWSPVRRLCAVTQAAAGCVGRYPDDPPVQKLGTMLLELIEAPSEELAHEAMSTPILQLSAEHREVLSRLGNKQLERLMAKREATQG